MTGQNDTPTSVVTAAAAGMSKRELMAAMALQGMLANPGRLPREPVIGDWERINAQVAIGFADALIAELGA